MSGTNNLVKAKGDPDRTPLPFEQIMAAWSIAAATCLGGFFHDGSDEESKRINALFASLFPKPMSGLTAEAKADLGAYEARISRYEAEAGPPVELEFDAKRPYEYLTQDPMREREKTFLLEAVIKSDQLEKGFFRVLDLGSGGGRIHRELGARLSAVQPNGFEVIGIDISIDNSTYAALSAKSNTAGRMFLVSGDITTLPFKSESASMCCINSVLQLVPLHKRPFFFLEMVRVMKINGEGVITGPNEKCSLAALIKNAFAGNPMIYMNPALSLMALQMAPLAVKVDWLSKNRTDYSYPDTEEICETLRMLGCDIIAVETWPDFYEGEDIFSGIRFKRQR